MYEDNLENNFIKSSNEVMKLSKKPDDKELLKLYGLYKQGLFGNNRNPEPSFFEFKEKSKHQAWMIQAGKGRSRAKKEYIQYVEQLKEKYN